MFKMGTLYSMLLIAVTVCGCTERSSKYTFASPDGSMYVLVDTTDQNPLTINIFDHGNNLLFRVQTMASSFQSWNVEWRDNRKVILDSADIGPVGFIRKDDGTWTRYDPLRAMSPDGTIAADVYWGRDSCLALALLQADGNASTHGPCIFRDETDIKIKDLCDSIHWLGNDRLMVTADDGNYEWKRNDEGEWKFQGRVSANDEQDIKESNEPEESKE